MRFFKYILVGIVFGVTLFKSEAVSWFRIYEMFNFQSFHMYGIIFSAVGVGILGIQIIKRLKWKNLVGQEIDIRMKSPTYTRYILGGTIFGLGWALAGVCPGPMFILMGSGYTVFIVFLASAMAGTFAYGCLRPRLPH
jgi:uncharacterized protein